jgi:hypothetical protein
MSLRGVDRVGCALDRPNSLSPLSTPGCCDLTWASAGRRVDAIASTLEAQAAISFIPERGSWFMVYSNLGALRKAIL